MDIKINQIKLHFLMLISSFVVRRKSNQMILQLFRSEPRKMTNIKLKKMNTQAGL
jgi:hypothetical protein